MKKVVDAKRVAWLSACLSFVISSHLLDVKALYQAKVNNEAIWQSVQSQQKAIELNPNKTEESQEKPNKSVPTITNETKKNNPYLPSFGIALIVGFLVHELLKNN